MKLVDGKLVDIRQDSSHTLGMICRRGKHAPEIIYSEHRLKYPMKRIGPKESYDFERITWDEAYQTIVAALNRIKDPISGENLVWWDYMFALAGSFGGITNDLAQG